MNPALGLNEKFCPICSTFPLHSPDCFFTPNEIVFLFQFLPGTLKYSPHPLFHVMRLLCVHPLSLAHLEHCSSAHPLSFIPATRSISSGSNPIVFTLLKYNLIVCEGQAVSIFLMVQSLIKFPFIGYLRVAVGK